MLRAASGCLRHLAFLAFWLVAAGLVWHYRGPLLEGWQRLRQPSEPTRPAAAGATAVVLKLGALAGEDPPPRVALGEEEVQSLVGGGVAGLVPPFIASPRVELKDGRANLEFRVATERLAGLADPAGHVPLLPDTTDLIASAQLIPLDARRMALAVDDLSAGNIPLPDRLIPPVLTRLGRSDEPGLPPDAMAVPLPPGAAHAYIRGDSLVFLAQRPAAGTS